MIDKFLLHPLPNTLAVLVLLTLIFSWFTSIFLALGNTASSCNHGWYTKLILLFSLLGIPAIYDLLQTDGTAFLFASSASLVIALNVGVLILRLTEKSSHPLVKDWFKWSIPIIAMGGLAVAGYYIYLQLTDDVVVCGPAGGCGPVLNSRFSKLFGILPMGTFGFAGYIAILAAWLLSQYGPASLKKLGFLSVWGFCIFGVLFSSYLTFLEPFVIGATCMWCITSAVFMMILLLASTPAAQQALAVDTEEVFLSNRA
jgi:uncharacterized membrane protein